MKPMSLRFSFDDVFSLDDLISKVSDWETLAKERADRGSLGLEIRTYYRGVSDAMQAVRLQFSKLNVGVRVSGRSPLPVSPPAEKSQEG